MVEEKKCCWICLDENGELVKACNCPENRVVHKNCLARWQLQSAGNDEEYACRFCKGKYPDWKEILTPVKPAIPVGSVHFNDIVYKIKVTPGDRQGFIKKLSIITHLSESELENVGIQFECKAPTETQETLEFKGMSAFDAAIHCASITAAKRAEVP